MSTDGVDNAYKRVVVIGAGAAGLAAGYKLHQAGIEVIILEARGRIGGRAWTNYDLGPQPVELGAEFIHGDKAITWSLLRQFNMRATDELDWGQASAYVYNQLLEPEAFFALPHAEELMWLSHIDKAAESWRKDGREDGNLAEAIGDDGLSDEIQTWFWMRFTTEMAAEPERLGVYGWLEETRAHDGEGDFRIVEGYSHLMERLAEGLDIRLNSPVERVAWGADGVTVYTRTDETFVGKGAIVTLPLGVLQSGDVIFEPTLPAEKTAAISGLGLGMANKLIFKFKEAFWPEQMPALLTTLNSQIWWRPGWGRKDEAPIITGMMGGESALWFAALGEERAIVEGLHHLELMFGLKNLQRQLVQGLFVAWPDDPYCKMGYSYVPVGGGGCRDKLAEPVGQVLFFAGEATNSECAATLHGALESGFRAADEVIR